LETNILAQARHGRLLAATIASALIVAVAAPRQSYGARLRPQSAARADANRVVTDEMGRKVKVPTDVKRIVTLAPNLTETVYALGLAEKLAGDTDFCDTPAEAKSKPHVGNPQSPSLEAIVALHPDLVLAADSINRVETADALQRMGIPVYTIAGDTQTVLAIVDSIGKMAELLGAPEQGFELAAKMRERLDALHARLSERPAIHVLFVVWTDPLITIGQNTFIADALRWAGAESVVLSKRNWPQISVEEVVRLQPDYIVFTSNHGGAGAAELADLRSRPAWRNLDAVEMGHVVDISDEALRPAPGLIDAIEQLARVVHPEAFTEKADIRNSKHETRFASDAATDFERRCEPCAR
jgi:iron complex transport system substrate-binding protein